MLTPQGWQKERDNIWQILLNNKCDASSLQKSNKERGQKQNSQIKRRAKFTYVGKETRFITIVLKNTNVKIAFTTDNTIEKCLALKQEAPHPTKQIKQKQCIPVNMP